jgi:tetratricopeptide (TPR) repeat protein
VGVQHLVGGGAGLWHDVTIDEGLAPSSAAESAVDTTEAVEALRAGIRSIGDVVAAWVPGERFDPAHARAQASIAPLVSALRYVVDAEALAAFEKAGSAEDPSVSSALETIAVAARRLVDAALALPVHDPWYGESTEQLADLMASLGWLAASVGRDEDALTLLLQAAIRLSTIGRAADAARLCEAIVNHARALTPLPRESLADALDLWSRGLDTAGRPDDAIARLNEARAIVIDPVRAAQLDSELGSLLLDVGEFDAGLRTLDRAYEVLDRESPEDPYVASTLRLLAEAHSIHGEYAKALEYLERARTRLDDARPLTRFSNARARATVYHLLGDYDAAGEAFQECFGYAKADVVSRLPRAHAVRGIRAEMAALAGQSSEVRRWQDEVDAARARHRADRVAPGQLLEACERVVAAAEAAGDRWTELVYRVEVVTALHLTGGGDPSLLQSTLWAIRAEALRETMTIPIALADVGLLNLIGDGLDDVGGPGDSVSLATEAIMLSDLASTVEPELASEFNGSRLRMPGIGIALIALARQAAKHGARDLGIDLFHRAIDYAQGTTVMGLPLAPNRAKELRYRVAMLKTLSRGAGRTEEVDGLETEVRWMLDNHELDAASRLLAHTELGGLRAVDHPQTALRDLRRAAELLEELRSGVRERNAAGSAAARRGVDDEYPVYHAMARAMIAADEPSADTFAVLQRFRARELLSTLADSLGAQPFVPPDVPRARSLLAALPVPTTFVDVTWAPWGLRAFIVEDDSEVRTVDALGDTTAVQDAPFGDVRRRAAELVAFTRNSSLLRDLAEGIEDAVEPARPLLVAVEDEMANIPLYAVPVGGRPWAETRSIGRIPAVGVLQFASTDVWNDSAVVAGDSRGDLPHAAAECERVAELLGATPLLGPHCTLEAVRQALGTGKHDVLHFALHGRADVRRGGRASLLFAESSHDTAWATFDDIVRLPWRAGLVVFSGCSTAVGGPRNGRGLYGVAQVAAQAGAGAVVASLWPVDDASTRVFMTAFYEELHRARTAADWVDLREVMDVARVTLREWLATLGDNGSGSLVRDGRDLGWDDETMTGPTVDDERDMLHWAPFVLLGHPVVRFARPR